MKKYYSQKVAGCQFLVNLNSKKINKTHIVSAANKVGIPVTAMELAWKNFQETGGKFVDKSSRNGNGRSLMKMTPTVKSIYTKMRTLKTKEMAEIILEYMTNRDINSRELSNKHKIPKQQFYSWIEELNNHGTLNGKTILNPKKYAKVNVVDAIWFYKRPETKRKSILNLTDTEKLAYKRVADVLVHYLSAI